MTFKLRRPLNFSATLPLKTAEVASKLANMSGPNVYLDAIVAGVPLAVDTNGDAVLADGSIPGNYIGFAVNGAMDNANANPGSLANKQITYTAGVTEVETDVVVGGVQYNPGDLLYCGTTTNKGLLTKTAPGTPDAAVAVVLKGRLSASTDLLWVKVLR